MGVGGRNNSAEWKRGGVRIRMFWTEVGHSGRGVVKVARG